MIRTYKIRLFPTKEQEQLFYKHIGACRFIWNWGLDTQIKHYEETGKKYSGYDLMKMLTPLKKTEECLWLNEISNASLQTILLDLDKAYKNFFKSGFGFPKFKSKKFSKKSFPIRCDSIYFHNETYIKVAKAGKVKYRTNYSVPIGRNAKLTNPRISLINNKWILTVGVECENQAKELTSSSMGIDLGIKDLAIVAVGNDKLVFKNINKTNEMRKLKKKLKRLQRKVSRKYHTNRNYDKSKNILKTEAQIRELSYHISNIRQNYIHQITRQLVDMLPYRVVMEDLNVSGMMKNRHLSKAVQEQCFFNFIQTMKYKCEEYEIEFVQADRFFPSSKTCSSCGHIKKDLKLSDRTYRCSECGTVIDRDYNAAINLMQYAC